MACILKVPSERSCGALVVSTQERDHQINVDPTLRADLERLKDRWLIGLHHNWHDLKFKYDPLYDFSMAGEGDLIEITNRDVPLLPMDACNFVPDIFCVGATEKFWDILYVARAVNFKRIPEFLQCIRDLYDAGHKYRVLFICPLPPYDPKEEKTVFYKIREVYNKMFSESEKDLFNLLTIDYRYPFPFDLQTLSHFYRSSKVFVHTADDEKRCRVAAYAWASGLPVVGMECVGGLLPPEARRPPYLFEPKSFAGFPEQIVAAVSSLQSRSWDEDLMRNTFTESSTVDVLDGRLKTFAERRGLKYEVGGMSKSNLSIRLGRHHNGKNSPNSIDRTLKELVARISFSDEDLVASMSAEDPERLLASRSTAKGIARLWARLVTRA